MTIPFIIVQTSVVLINALSIWLAFIVLSKSKNKKAANLFTWMIIFMLVWVDFAFLARSVPETGILFIRLAWCITPLFFVLIYFFTEQIVNSAKRFDFCQKLLLGIGIINIPFVFFTPHVIKNISATAQGVIDIEYGGFEWLFFSQILILSGLILSTLMRSLRKEKIEHERIKIKYLLVGFSFFLVMNSIFNIIFPVFFQKFGLYAFGDYSTIFFLGFIAYAITKKNLFGIRIVLSTLLIVLLSIVLLIDLLLFTDDILWIRIFKFIIFISFVGLGYSLIKSISKEVQRREELESLSNKIVETNIQLREANQKLKKLDKAKSEFISIASHQLRTPLTAIKGYLSMIKEKTYGDLNPEVEAKMGDVLKSTDRLIHLVNDLLSVSRIESGKIELEFGSYDIAEFIRTTVDELKINAEEENLYLKLETNIESYQIQMDEVRMRQVVLNIIDNAIKYTSEGGITIRLNLQKIASGKDSIIIEISDTGEGMTQKDIKNIFNSFARGSAGDIMHTEGAGLGLYIAKKFVDMHKGNIWIKSKGKGEGTTFFIELPTSQ